jgi:hypothetical protein
MDRAIGEGEVQTARVSAAERPSVLPIVRIVGSATGTLDVQRFGEGEGGLREMFQHGHGEDGLKLRVGKGSRTASA